MEEIFFEKTF